MRVVRISTRGAEYGATAEIVHGRTGRYLVLAHGEQGRGRRQWRLPLGVKDFPPPDGMEAPLIERLSIITTRRGTALGVAERADDRHADLVLLSLSPGFRGGATYCVDGVAQVLGEGYEAQGLAGRMGGAPCPVIRADGPAVLLWHRTGRLYDTPARWIAQRDAHGHWTVAPEELAAEEQAALGQQEEE